MPTKPKTVIKAKKPTKTKARPKTGTIGWKPASDPGDYIVHITCPLCGRAGECFIFDNVSSPIIKYGCDNCERLFTAATPPSSIHGREPGQDKWDRVVKPVVEGIFGAVVESLDKSAEYYERTYGKNDYSYGFASGIRMAASLIRNAKV
ncbi:hypothetical protein J8F10_14320 [Gemmata sp. G18]|uniref:Uncharacterized protein n=1 Tax=Gemmata palustris TaxID=2822762 RepID=A0ABS5BRT6_9BACT|nr:hypothetical protein [Gemmata palustris]MBP3956452.1 hypothetical protein [Gemmata palustris]